MADTFSKKEREKKKAKRKKEKEERREQRKNSDVKGNDIMYVDAYGNFTSTPPGPQPESKVRKEDIRVSVPSDDELETEDLSRSGKVKFFDDEKGYGFILDELTGESYFAHATNLIDEIAERDKVIFELENGQKGPMAVKVRLVK